MNGAVRACMVGPDIGVPGGMATVMTTIADVIADDPGHRCRIVNSGGGRGPEGWWGFPAALASVGRNPGDVVHLHVASGGSTWRKMAFAAAAKARRRPYIVHLHGAGYRDFIAGLSTPQVAAVSKFFRGAARVIVLGDSWNDFVTDALGLPAGHVVVIRNGVAEVTGPRSDDGLTRAVYVGEVSRRKGADVLMSVAGDLLDAHPRLALELLGPLVDDELAARGRELEARFPGRFVLAGSLTGTPKDRRVAAASIFVLPSRAEGLPMAMLEAMSASLAPVVTPVGAIGEVITDDENGLLVEPGDAEALSAALDRLAGDPALVHRLGRAARRTWRADFSASHMVDQIASLWDAVAGGRRG